MSKKDSYKETAEKNKIEKNNKSVREKKLEELEKSSKKSKPYKNPASTVAGKIIIIILALLMCFSGLFSLLWVIFWK